MIKVKKSQFRPRFAPVAILFVVIVLTFALAACRSRNQTPATDTRSDQPTAVEPIASESDPAPASEAGDPTAEPTTTGNGPGMGGPSASMMQFHQAPIPAAYADLSSPVAADEASLAAGKVTYDMFCATCHGEGGLGDGPAGQALNPPAAPVARTSLMMGDAYLFWRISEGGAAFGTAMTPWKDILDEEQRWDVINYMRSLGDNAPGGMGMSMGMGRGTGSGAGQMAGQMADEAAHRAEMLAEGVAAGLITQEDAATFEEVHAVLDEFYMADLMGMGAMDPAAMQEMQRALTNQAVADGRISQDAADSFTVTHDLLVEAGIMR